ncbi:MAG: 30S ribosomal protein S9 [Chloroflexi bacterium]|nr:30S ribosomal protein S9 [Chloroflexota bacterium]MBU1750888.1 30S ribosomal protein S9 [Chloroflexota bacterium]MBU1879479.1 30S ribosomal protein S9 [Chloroflexota bacterium]
MVNVQRYHYATGRRKTAVARVRLFDGNGEIVVNDKPLGEYFPTAIHQRDVLTPLRLTSTEKQYSATVKVRGGGVSGQAGAVRHGLARALIVADPSSRSVLKKAGLLTRDPRVKERKKPGLRRARRAKQYTKR